MWCYSCNYEDFDELFYSCTFINVPLGSENKILEKNVNQILNGNDDAPGLKNYEWVNESMGEWISKFKCGNNNLKQ